RIYTIKVNMFISVNLFLFSCFFFQAEDGIRDFHVTGVQTCALPICRQPGAAEDPALPGGGLALSGLQQPDPEGRAHRCDWSGLRSEERRVGKECRTW